jgi:hypothetical protein
MGSPGALWEGGGDRGEFAAVTAGGKLIGDHILMQKSEAFRAWVCRDSFLL